MENKNTGGRPKGSKLQQKTKLELKNEINKQKKQIEKLTKRIEATHERIEDKCVKNQSAFIKVNNTEGGSQYINSSFIKSLQDSNLTPRTMITYYDNEGLLVTNSIEALVTQLNFLT